MTGSPWAACPKWRSRRHTSPRSARTSPPAQGRSPAAEGWRAARRESRGRRRGRSAGQPRLERRIDLAHRLPVRLQIHHGTQVQVGRPLRVRARGHQADAGTWLVVPAIGALATSTASTPTSMAASKVASWPPAVSWVCRCTGRSKFSRSAATSFRAAGGRSSRPCP